MCLPAGSYLPVSCCNRHMECMTINCQAVQRASCFQAVQGDNSITGTEVQQDLMHTLQEALPTARCRNAMACPKTIVWCMQVVQESNVLKGQAKDQDEADPFARLHPGRRLFLPSLAQEGAESAPGGIHCFPALRSAMCWVCDAISCFRPSDTARRHLQCRLMQAALRIGECQSLFFLAPVMWLIQSVHCCSRHRSG